MLNSAWVSDAATYIEQYAQSPELLTRSALSQRFYLSPGHLQTVFKQVMGMTPAQYARAVRQQRLREALTSSENATEAVFEAGYSSLSQAYDKGGVLGMTPRQYQRKGAGMTIRYAAVETSYGWMLVAATERGLCTVSLHNSHDTAITSLQTEFAEAQLTADTAALAGTVQQIVAHIEGALPSLDLPIDVQATAFQMRVWNALRQIPHGETWSYSELAEHIGDPKATRAVAAACGANRLAVVIPCHRVVGKSGNLTGYKWGIERKRLLLAREKDQRSLFD
jgi:AraC family transcriptional regulator of adaptative response/methylated-DNA-[protein]-cysteine methyltransferase